MYITFSDGREHTIVPALGTVRVGFAGRREARQRARLVRAHEAGVAEPAKIAASPRSIGARPSLGARFTGTGSHGTQSGGQSPRMRAAGAGGVRRAGTARGGQRGPSPWTPEVKN